MEVILLERVAKLGQMGEVVRVKDGFARNFLLKRGKALRATSDNRAKFDGMKSELEARNLQAKGEATKVAEKIDGKVKVEIADPKLCSRYTATLIRNVALKSAPRWMRSRLHYAGMLRPISNVVDITNYVMVEHGQPLHAFD